MPRTRSIAVPLEADYVMSPIVRYGDPFTAIFFLIEPSEQVVDASPEAQYESPWGRITFEGFDAIRCSRGEYAPYGPEQPESWVYEVLDSQWLSERHEYESSHYDTPLLDDYHHYLFCFHDEFVEAIAKGIWIESIGQDMNVGISANHPLKPLPVDLPAQSFVSHGLQCEVRQNPLPLEQIVEASKLCSQKLFQFYLILGGQRSESYAALLRTVNGKSETRFQAGWPFPNRGTTEGIAKVEDLMPAWEAYVQKVAQRRKEMGKND